MTRSRTITAVLLLFTVALLASVNHGRQIFRPSTSAAGLNVECAALPDTPSNGDFACDSGASNVVKVRSNGAWVDAGGVAGLVLLETETASDSATLDFSCPSSTYDKFVFELTNILPATDNADLLVRMSTDSGSTFDAGNNYGWAVLVWRAGATASTGAESGAASVNLINYGLSNNASWSGAHGSVELFNPAGGAVYRRLVSRIISFGDSGQYHLALDASGSYLVTTAVTDVRFLMDSGNITSGTIRCYGIAK